MSVTSDLIRGNTDMIILARLCKSDSYGYRINKMIREATAGEFEFKEATLYTAFKRLEDAGYISSYWGNESTGARRRYYSVTQLGKKHFELLKEEWKSSQNIIDKLMED